MSRRPPRSTLFPYTTLFRSRPLFIIDIAVPRDVAPEVNEMDGVYLYDIDSLQSIAAQSLALDRKSTRLNSSHANISYAVFCLKKKKKGKTTTRQKTDRTHAS